MDQFSYIANADTAVIADLYESYLQDPNSVDVSWQNFFKGFDFYTSWNANGSSEVSLSTNGVATKAGAATADVLTIE